MRPMRTEKHPNTPSQEMQEKEMKTLTSRKQAFTRIHRNSLSPKIQEDSGKQRKTRYLPKVHRTVNIGKTSVFLHSRAFAVRENVRKLL